MKAGALALSLLGLGPILSMAEDAPPPPPQDVWTGKGQAGYVSSQGNSNAKSANAALDMAYLDGPWKHAFHLGGLYGENAGIVSAERWDTGWQTNYDLTAKVFTFGQLNYLHDMFSGFQYQASAAGGFGYKILDTTGTKLSAQLGMGYQELRPEILQRDPLSGAVVGRILQGSAHGVVATAGVNYSQALTDTTTLTDKLTVSSGSADTLLVNALAVAVKISTKLSLSVGYTLQDNTKPPVGSKKTDTLETVNLVYAF